MTLIQRAPNHTPTAADFLDLFRTHLELDGWRATARLIETHWDTFALTEPQVLLEAFKALPSEGFMENPTWLIEVDYLRYVASGAAPHAFRRSFNVAADAPGRDLSLRERLIGMTSKVADHRSNGRITDAVSTAIEARRLLDHARKDELAELRLALPHLTIQWARALDLGDSHVAVQEYEETCTAALMTGQTRVARRAAASLAWMYAEQGHLREARVWLDRANDFDVEIDRYDIPLILAAALLCVDSLDIGKARDHLAKADKYMPGEYWAAALWVRALVCTRAEEIIIIENLMMMETRRHSTRSIEHGAHQRHLALAQWILRVRQGALQIAQEHDDHTHIAIAAEKAYRQGRFTEAHRLVVQLMKDDLPPRLWGMALLITAASRLRLGRRDSAVDAFRRAHAMLQHEGLSMVFATIDAQALHELASASQLYVDPAVLQFLQNCTDDPRPAIPSLTRREQQVLRLLASGMSNNEITETLFISLNTLKSTIRHLYRKLGVHDRTEASDIAHQIGLDNHAA
jgi:DNA-binding CsgD family transcriptional regulator/tetratricopeptide (TPR) repeat protein